MQHTETYQYDLNGNLSLFIDRKNQATAYTYDGLDRLTQVRYADQSTITYTYDAGNRLTQMADSLAGTITRSYDGLDRLRAIALESGWGNGPFATGGRNNFFSQRAPAPGSSGKVPIGGNGAKYGYMATYASYAASAQSFADQYGLSPKFARRDRGRALLV